MVYNIKSNNSFYINNQQDMKSPRQLSHNQNYGLCNIDLGTIWPKTQHGLELYTQTLQASN